MTAKSTPSVASILAFAADPVADLPFADRGESAPEWVHLFTRGKALLMDGRNLKAVYQGGALPLLHYAGRQTETRVPVDINHANAKRSHKGEMTPAVGWIVAVEERPDGLWGRVEWNDQGKALLAQKAYRGISPEFYTDANGNITGLCGASLVNRPALGGLTPLFTSAHPEGETEDMEKLALIAVALGLLPNATAETVLAGAEKLKADQAASQDSLAKLALAVGAAQDADSAAILAAAEKLKSPADMVPKSAVADLQGQIKTLSAELGSLREAGARKAAESVVDAAIKEGRMGLPPSMRDHYIGRHMASAEGAKQVEAEIAAMPKHVAGRIIPTGEPPTAGAELASADAAVAKAMGVDPEDMKKIRAAEAANKEAA